MTEFNSKPAGFNEATNLHISPFCIKFLLLVFIFFWASSGAFAQANPPDRVRLTTIATGNQLEWQDGGNNGATTLIRYEIGRSTSRGGAYTVIGNTTALSYVDSTATAGTQYYYVVRDVNTGGTSAWSGEVIRFYPFTAPSATAIIYKNENQVNVRWPIYENEIVKTFIGLSTNPGEANLTGFTDVGHATSHSFSGISLQEGQTYYVTVRVQDTSGYLHGYGTSICSSPGFTFEKARTLTDDTAAGFFNNAQARVMTSITGPSVGTVNFGNNVLRRYRVPVTLRERGIESRLNAPVEINIGGSGFPTTLANARNQIRVADEWGNEVPSNVTAAGAQLITQDVYNAGVETINFIEGYSAGAGGTADKNPGSLYLEATTNNVSVRTFVTELPIDLSTWDEIEVNWQNTGVNNNGNRSFFVVSSNQMGNYDDFDARLARTRTFNVTETLDVSGISGNRYLRIHANDNGRDSRVSTYRITLRRTENRATMVLIANIPKGGSQKYWVYWGGGSAAYADFITNSNDTSQRAWSRYYSRKLLPPGIESDPISSWVKLYDTYGDSYDTGGTWVDLPWDFPYFATTRDRWFLAIKGTLTGVVYRDYSNTWNEFIANAADRDMISPLWLDTAIRDSDTQPQNIGFYTLLKNTGQPDERQGFFWRANRYGELTDIYMFQTFLYRYGDIAHRYEYLTYAGLWVQGTWDNPVNVTHHTVGISDNNGNDYFWSTPLREGSGVSPTSFFQYKNAVDFDFGTTEDAGAGLGFAGHIDSHIFDSRAGTPNWQTMEYEVTANGGSFNFLIRSGPTPEPGSSWTGWTQVVTNANANGSVPIPSANNQRFLQYRCVFLKAATGNNPLLNRVNFICRGLEITQITANTPDGVSQGQDNILVTVNVKNFHSTDIELTDLELLFDLGSYTQTLNSHVLPATIPAGGDIDFEFFVDVWPDSPTGLATIHAAATGTAGVLTFADLDADTPHTWQVRKKAELYIKQIDATPVTVNKGQTVLVRMLLENHGDTPLVFDAATLTFSLGSYDQFVTQPPPGTLINGQDSIIATFSVTIKPESPSGVAILDGSAEGRDSLSQKIASDSSAEITDSWIIQNPAVISLQQITAPEIVYRGQTNVPVKLTVNNEGEAELNWDRSFILPYFTLGTYDSVIEVSSFPLNIFGGSSIEGDYYVNISPSTATGTSSIDAKIEGTDLNTGFMVEDEFAVNPATWTIIQEFVKTYGDSALLFQSDSFNRPESGNVTIYAQAEQLAPFQEYTIRWYDPDGIQIEYTNPPITSSDDGKISHQLTLDSTVDYGIWTVRITNPLNTHTACENQFSIVSVASLAVDLQLPAKVTIGQPFNASMTFFNTGGAEIQSAYPGSFVKTGPGDANINAGPDPALHDIPGYEQATFSFALSGVLSGDFSLDGTGYGYDANSGAFLTAATQTSTICKIQDPPQLVISDLSSDLIEVNLNQQGIEVLLSISNEAAAGFTPPDYYLYDTGTENVTFVAGFSEGTGDSQQAKQAAQLYLRARGEQTGGGWNPVVNEAAERTYVTDVPIDLTNVNYIHIRWRNTGDNNADNHSYFVVSPNKNGDHSDSTLSIPRTRNFAWTEESIGVGGLSGNYYIRVHARDNTDAAQVNSVVNVEQIWLEYATIPGEDQAGAYIEAASLTFDFGTHYQVIDSPTLPFFLAPGDTEIIKFIVSVDPESDTGLANISGSVLAEDENWQGKFYGITGGTHFWTIRGVRGLCSANSSYNPEQYSFNIGQTVYARFENLPLNQNYRIRFYNNAPDGGTMVKSSPPLNSGAYGICDDLWTLDGTEPETITRQWRVFIHDGSDTVVGNILSTQFFEVQNPGKIETTLTLEPASCFVGDQITATLQINNPDANSSTIASITAVNLVKTSASTGELSQENAVSPDSLSLPAENAASFTWTFTATNDTGTVGSFSMTAELAFSAAGYDVNSLALVESDKALSNSIFIYRRALEVASLTLLHGAKAPGETTVPLVFAVENIGNYQLDKVKWVLVDLKNESNDYLSKSRLVFDPAFVGTINVGNSSIAQNYIEIPSNQPSGIYIATMSVYEDLNDNGNRESEEPFDLFSVQIEVLSAKNISLPETFFDLGNWAPGQTSISKEVEFFNSGNINLDRVRIEQISGSATFQIVDPLDHGALVVAEHGLAEVYANIPGGTTPGIYIATWTVYEDENNNGNYDIGEPNADFSVRTGIGDKSFSINPAIINLGNASPTFTLEGTLFDITNDGLLPLDNLAALTDDLENLSGDKIASDNVVLLLPTNVGVGATEVGTLNYYTPAGTPAGTYNGTQWVYDDANMNGIWDNDEASASFELQVEVIEYRAIQVIPSTVDLGDLAAGTGGSTMFWCRNIGNVTLPNLRWSKVDLHSSTDTIPSSEYYFPPAEPFTVAPGVIFQREVTINVPAGKDDGNYLGNVAWLYEDMEAPTGTLQPTEPQDSFQLGLRVGNHSLDILEATVTTSGPPSELSAAGTFNVQNTGSLTISKLRATATALIGPDNIANTASFFTPNPAGILVTGQSRSINWQVQVPANTLAGFYNGTVTVWNDSNGNGIIDAAEASTNATLQFEVLSKRIIEVLPPVLDLGWATENSTAQGQIEIINRGNVALTDLTGLSATIFNAAMDSISNITFTPNPVGSLDIGLSTPATITVTVASPQSTGVYSGVQRVYDDYRAPSGSFTADEESDTFELRISIGEKDIDVSPLVTFAATDPGLTVNSPAFSVTNLTVIPLTRLKWSKSALSNGSDLIPIASLTFTPPTAPATYFGLGSSASNNSCQARLVIGPNTPPGSYNAQQTIWEDDNNNGIIDAKEASATLNLEITINPKYAINILPATIDLGNVTAGAGSALIDVDIQNNGNTVLNTFNWNFLDLLHADGHTISATLLKTNMPAAINPGQTVTAQLYLDAIPAGQPVGIYQTAGHALLSNGGSSDNCEILVNIEASETDIFGPDTVYQNIDQSVFNDLAMGQSSERLILSAMVNPGSGSANISFFTVDLADAPRRVVGISINHDGTLTTDENPAGTIIKAGYTLRIPHQNHPDFPTPEPTPNWFRIFIAFDFAFDSANENGSYIVLKNSSASTGHAVWIDAVQLEKALIEGQELPTNFGTKPKIISPSKNLDLHGMKEFYRW